jgi:DUF1009 family protein
MHQGNDGTALGLIAGAGSLPIEVARLLRGLGYSLFAIGFDGLTDRALEAEVEDARWVRLGKLDAMAKAMHELGARRFILIGKVPKALLFENRGIAEPDAEAIRLLAEERDRGDEPLMNAIARWIEGRGFQLCDQGEMLAPMLAAVGPLSARSPSETELADLAIGLPIVQELGRLGIGQCVVVKEGSVLAVEAIEGTDSVIARAGELGGSGATVIKAARPGQDRRFDLPAVGVGTINAICASGASGLAIEAGSTLIVDRKGMTEAADRANIAVWGFSTGRLPA